MEIVSDHRTVVVETFPEDEGLAEYISAANQFFNNEVQDPAMSNKHNSWTLTMRSMVTQSEQVRAITSEFMR